MLSNVKFLFSFLTLLTLFFILNIEVIVTKIHIHNTESLSNKNNYKVSRKSRIGTILLSLFVASAITAGTVDYIEQSSKRPELDAMIPTISVDVSLDEVNSMNIILNDDDCSDSFFQDVVSQLQEDGLEVTTTQGGDGINQNNATVITLDQQYSAGEGTIIFAPYDNARVGHSDSLALSMQAAFQQNGFLADEISCAQTGYHVDEEGNVQYYVPTPTEEQIEEGYDTSFVTISFGTQNQNAEWVAKSIENGLARQNYHLNSDDNQTDLIYRANSGDSIDGVSDYFGTTPSKVRQFNEMAVTNFSDSQTVVNPSVEDMPAFEKGGMFQLGGEKTRAY